MPYLYLTYPLITAAAYTLGVSEVMVTDNYREPVILYTLVSGRSGTNKTGSLSMVRRLVEGIKSTKQNIFDTGTIEGLMSTLRENDGAVITMVDEFSTFIDSLDKNSNGNSERSRYLSLWSGNTINFIF